MEHLRYRILHRLLVFSTSRFEIKRDAFHIKVQYNSTTQRMIVDVPHLDFNKLKSDEFHDEATRVLINFRAEWSRIYIGISYLALSNKKSGCDIVYPEQFFNYKIALMKLYEEYRPRKSHLPNWW